MKRLFRNDEKNYRYAIVALLVFFSFSLSFSPTGLVSYSKQGDIELLDIAFGSDRVRDFVASHDSLASRDIIIGDITDSDMQSYPNMYSGVPPVARQIIFDAGDDSMVVILDNTVIYRIFEI